MLKKAYRIAFVGGGLNSAVGMTHKIASQMDGHFRLAAGAFSKDSEMNKKTAEEWGVQENRLYENYCELFEKEKGKIDAIVILTPTDTHKKIILEALEAGYPVISEKSLATSYQDGLAIEKMVDEKKAFFCITYNYTGYPMVRELKRLIANGKFGKIQQIQIEMPQEGFIRLNAKGEPPRPQAWRLKDRTIPTISLDLGTHLHNMILFLTNEKPLEILSDQDTFGLFNQIVDNVNCIVKYTHGMKAQIWFSKTALGERNGLRFRIYGNKGSAEWYQMDPENLKICDIRGNCSTIDRTSDVEIANQPRYNRFKAGHPAGFIEAFANHYSDIATCLTQYLEHGCYSSEYIFGIKPSLEGLQMMQIASESAKDKEWKKVDNA